MARNPNYLAPLSMKYQRAAQAKSAVTGLPIQTFSNQKFNIAGDQQGQYDALTQRINALNQQLAQANQKVYAPSIDYNAINTQARQQAESAINPLYVKRMNRFIAQQTAKRKQRQGQYNLEVQGLQRALQETLEGSQIQRGRTEEDVASNLANIADEADVFQTQSGRAFEQGREQLGQELAATGLGRSGLGAQQVDQAVEQQNEAEQQQTQQFEQAREQQELFKNRTFEDLLRGDELAKTAKKAGQKESRFNLDSYIKNLKFETAAGKEDIEERRLAALSSEQDRRRSTLIRSFIEGIADPRRREAAYSTYGGFL